MPRRPRIVAPNLTYHIIIRCNNSEHLISSRADFSLFRSVISRYKAKYKFKLYAYCILNTHIHLIIESPEDADISISKIMHAICWRYAYRYNRSHNRRGHFFMGRYKSCVVQEDVYGITLLKYISQNPVRAGLVKKGEEWEWSSYRVYSEGEYDPLIDLLPSYEGMSADKRIRGKMFREMVEMGVDDKNDIYTRGYIIGERVYVERVLGMKLDIEVKPPG